MKDKEAREALDDMTAEIEHIRKALARLSNFDVLYCPICKHETLQHYEPAPINGTILSYSRKSKFHISNVTKRYRCLNCGRLLERATKDYTKVVSKEEEVGYGHFYY